MSSGPRYILPVTESAPIIYASPGQNTAYMVSPPVNPIVPPPVTPPTPPPKTTNWGAWIFWTFIILIILILLVVGLIFLFRSMSTAGNKYADKTSYQFNANTPDRPVNFGLQGGNLPSANVSVNGVNGLRLPQTNSGAVGYQAPLPQFNNLAPLAQGMGGANGANGAVGYQPPVVSGVNGLPALGYNPI